jgi:hypothetical protein
LSKMKESPIPGSRDGHHLEWGRRPPTDLYLIGGKVSEDEKSVFMKNYIPPVGESGDNQAFIKNARANMIHFSIVSYTKDLVFRNDEGYIEKIQAVESIKGERNDAVEHGLGAMKQKTNSYDNIKQGATMELSEMIEKIKNCLSNGSVDKKKVCTDLGVEILTEEHKNAVAVIGDLKKNLKTENVVEKINQIMKENDTLKDENFKAVRNQKMNQAFGAVGTDEKPNLKREAADLIVTGKYNTIEELDQAIEKAKENSVVKSFAAKQADVTSETNLVGKEIFKKNSDSEISEFVAL